MVEYCWKLLAARDPFVLNGICFSPPYNPIALWVQESPIHEWCLIPYVFKNNNKTQKPLTHAHEQTHTHTHKHFCFNWGPWSCYQQAKRDLWVPKVLRLNACFPVCLISLMFRWKRCHTTKPRGNKIPCLFSDSLDGWNGWVVKNDKSTAVWPVHIPAMIVSKCWPFIKLHII